MNGVIVMGVIIFAIAIVTVAGFMLGISLKEYEERYKDVKSSKRKR